MKKVLSIVLSIAMVVCLAPTMAFAATTSAQADAAYSDIAGTSCEGAVNVLSALKVVDGFTDGTFKPEQTVTRAQMAKLVVTALGVADYATAKTSKYTDMGNAAWAIPYVEYASNLNIVNGVGNGKFNPNGTVTYEQAATMIVRALGYTDQCKEMNGTWPAIYVQKAMALGIFSDVVNGGANGATRGDTAIMLFNAIDLPEVYADGDGATQYKNGSTPFIGSDGKTFKGTSMLATLNKDAAAPAYGVVGADDADNAVSNIRSLVAAVGKVYTNKDGDVLSIGDIKSQFVTGTVNGDKDKLTAKDGTVYSINSTPYSTVDSTTGVTTKTVTIDKDTTSVANVPYFVNGVQNGSATLDKVDKNEMVTLAAKISGKTITNIYSISTWSKSDKLFAHDLFEEGDATTITSKHKLEGFEFLTDDNDQIDTTTFELSGVDSLDKIAEDNVVYVYADKQGKIRKVEIGTKTVEGTLDSFTIGTKSSTGDKGKSAKFEIGGTTYSGSKVASTDSENYADWLRSGDDDNAQLGDTVKAYLDASGNVYQLEKVSSGSTDYALIVDLDPGKSGNKVNDMTKSTSTGKYTGKYTSVSDMKDDPYRIKLVTSKGETVTLEVKDEATVSNTDTTAPQIGDVVTYTLNSSNKIKNIDVKSNYEKSASNNITKKGYVGGVQILDSAVIFSIETGTGHWLESGAIDSDDVSIIKLSTILDTTGVTIYGKTTTSKGLIDGLVVNSSATSDDIYYGLVTSRTTVDSDKYDGKYRVTMLVNGESKTYYTDNENIVKNAFYAFKLDSKGLIEDGNDCKQVGPTNTTGLFAAGNNVYLGYAVAANDEGISVSSNRVTKADGTKVSLDSAVKYYNYDGGYVVGDKNDLTGADNGAVAFFFDIESDKDDLDGVADLVIIADNATRAKALAAGFGDQSKVDEAIKSITKNETTAEVKSDADDTAKANAAIAAAKALVEKNSDIVTGTVTKVNDSTYTVKLVATSGNITAEKEVTVKVTIKNDSSSDTSAQN